MYRQKIKIEIKAFIFDNTRATRFSKISLGNLDKTETRSIAEKLKLNVAQPDSQDICFVPNDYASV